MESQILAGKVAVITGTSSGGGRGMAKVFAEEGARIVGIARRKDLGEEVAREVRAAGGEMVFYHGDVSRWEDCRNLVELAVETFGGLDVMVANAGVVGARPIIPSHELTEEEWDEVADVNLKGVFFCNRFAIAKMKELGRGGCIINISSINAIIGTPRMLAYNAAKAGVIQLSRTLALEYAADRIRVNAILAAGPVGGGTATQTIEALTKHVLGPDAEPPFRLSGGGDRVGPEEQAKILAFLASDHARFINGAAIAIDGGATAGRGTGALFMMPAYVPTS